MCQPPRKAEQTLDGKHRNTEVQSVNNNLDNQITRLDTGERWMSNVYPV